MKIEKISKLDLHEYSQLCEQSREATFYSSFNHLSFLTDVLGIQPEFIIAKDDDELIGVLPYFCKSTNYGNVFNSLPFFGSYGGIISKKQCHKEILDFFNEINKEDELISSVIITNPFMKTFNDYENIFSYNFVDKRRIQCIELKNTNEEKLWLSFEQRVRRSIRKASKENIIFETSELNEKIIDDFYILHKKEMDSKNGKSKPKNFFHLLKKHFTFGVDYELYIAKKDSKAISYLLIFYSKSHAEYYMPAYDADFKYTQSTSLLIWESIKSALKKNLQFYNFGGTWDNQPELHRFKRGWSSVDYFYNYYIHGDIEKIKSIGMKKILSEFPYFYVAPFNQIT